MKKNYLLLTIVLLLANVLILRAQQDTVLIDFGDPGQVSISPWNNMTSQVTGTIIDNLLNSTGGETNISVNVYDAFGGINTGGTQTPDAAAGFPASATRDSYYGCDVIFGTILEPTGGIEFTGLNPGLEYKFVIFASRMSVSDNREAQYLFMGHAVDTVLLDAANNAANTVSATLRPNVNGTIKVEVSPGPNNNNANGFFYLGAMKMIYDHTFVPKDTISVDFGDPTMASDAPWNNMTARDSGTAVAQLVNMNGMITPYGLMVYDAFGGINTGGTQTPDAELSLPASASRDSYFGSTVLFGGTLEPTGGVKLTSLDTAKTYTLEFFASRMSVSDNRETRYLVTGSIVDSTFLNPSNNSTDMVSVNMKPDAEGTIKIVASPGPNNNNSSGFYYFGSMKVIYESEVDANLYADFEGNIPKNGVFGGSDFSVVDNPNKSGVNTSAKVAMTQKVNDGTEQWWGGAYFPCGGTINFAPDAQMFSIDVLCAEAGEVMCKVEQGAQGAVEVHGNYSTPGEWQTVTFDMSSTAAGVLNPDYKQIVVFMGVEQSPINHNVFYYDNIRGPEFIPGDKIDVTYEITDLGGTVSSMSVKVSNGTSVDLTGTQGEGAVWAGEMSQVEGSTIKLPLTYTLYVNGVADTDNKNVDFPLAGSGATTVTKNYGNPPTDMNLLTNGGFDGIEGPLEARTGNEWGMWSDNGGTATITNGVCTVAPVTAADNWHMQVEQWNFAVANGIGYTAKFTAWAKTDRVIALTIEDPANGYATLGSTEDAGAYNGRSKWDINITTEPTEYELHLTVDAVKSNTTPKFAFLMAQTADSVFIDDVSLKQGIVPTGNDTISIDFGDPSTSSAAPWNNMNSTAAGTMVSHLINMAGKATPYSISVYDAFGEFNLNGTTTPDPSLDMPSSATSDSFWGNTEFFSSSLEPTGGFELSGLDPVKSYNLRILASRMSVSDNREGQYVFTGSTVDTAYLDAANNSSNLVSVDLKPKSDGTIRIQASPGPNNTNSYHFYYINAMQIVYQHVESEPLMVTSPNGGEVWRPGSTQDITWVSDGLTEGIDIEYSVDNGTNWTYIGNVASTETSYSWTVPNVSSTQCLVSLTSGDFSDVSDHAFTITSAHSCNIVVLGSSTAAGTGPSVIDSAWVWRYRAALEDINTKFDVINLAVGGYTTYQILPTGTPITGVSETIDVNHNVTKALTYNPYAIIVNMPSNDATKYYGVQQQLDNFKLVNDYASEAGIKVWFATPQPRNFSDAVQIKIQEDMVDTLPYIYGDYTIDFWTGIADSNGKILSAYDSGDGIHLNNAGHRILFERVMAKQIDTLECYSPDDVVDISANNKEIKVYPNPYTSQFTLEIEAASMGEVNIVLFDVMGRQIYNDKFDVSSEGKHTVTITNDQLNTPTSLVFGIVTVNDREGVKQSRFSLVKTK